MTIDATFWVAISFFIFFGILIYLKVPQKINNLLTDEINEIKKELNEAERLKFEAKNLLSNYENKIDKSKKETREIINSAKKESEKMIIEVNEKFFYLSENSRKITDQMLRGLDHFCLRLGNPISILYLQYPHQSCSENFRYTLFRYHLHYQAHQESIL